MMRGWLSAVVLLLLGMTAQAQVESDERPLLDVRSGVSIKQDSSFQMILRFRMQNRFGYTSVAGNNLSPESIEGRIRRLRLRFDGYALSPRLGYYIQLSFSRSDQDLDNQPIPQIIRDAIIYYTISKRFYIGFGQSKLPGNRQRVLSSGNLQFAERSIANRTFNIDRDFGLFGYYTQPVGRAQVKLKGAISTGDGRNANAVDAGLAYTARIEVLPFGAFTNGGDYSEGDLEREPTPKLSLATTLNFNDNATRVGGQLGRDLYEPRDFTTFIADLMFKYRGFGLMVEYMNRQTANPLTFNDLNDVRYVYNGWGYNAQVSYVTANFWEVALRYTGVRPDVSIRAFETPRTRLGVGTTHYLNGHRIKIQGNVFYGWQDELPALSSPGSQWEGWIQVEFGI